MNNFVKIVNGWVQQYYEPNKDGTFVCTNQEFVAGDDVYCENYSGEVIESPDHEYQTYDMPVSRITADMLAAIEAGKNKVKRIEAKEVPAEFRKDSAWLEAIYDVVNRTGLAIRDEIEKIGG